MTLLPPASLQESLVGRRLDLGVFEVEVCDLLAWSAVALLHAVLVLLLFGAAPAIFIWAERKVSGRIQDRLGPTRVGGRFGWLQSLADGIKLVQKEDLVPATADGPLFRLAPYIVCASSFAAFIVLPFSPDLAAVAADAGLFFLLAVLSLEVIGVILAGCASGSKWALFGGIREAAQMVSYEVPLSLCVLVPAIAAGSLNLLEISDMQAGWFWNWLAVRNPFALLAFLVFFVTATASCKRAPFDLAEAESELVAGFLTEYSGMRWSLFFLGEYARMLVVCLVAGLLFLGGWNTGIGPVDAWVYEATRGADSSLLARSLGNLFAAGVLIAKGSLLVLVQIWIRWSLPRLRIDQVMTTCLKYLVPISAVLLLGAVLWPLALGAVAGRTDLVRPAAEPVVPTLPTGDLPPGREFVDAGPPSIGGQR